MAIIVTGGAGFIGSNFVVDWFRFSDEPVVVVDKITYAGNINSLTSVANRKGYFFYKCDIADSQKISSILEFHRPRAILNFAAESHVDRSIKGPEVFIDTNIVGTFKLLESARSFWDTLETEFRNNFRFLHISTDEVYGSLNPDAPAFSESNRYEPNSPYSASKAASDHLVRSWHHTYGLPTLTTNCSNNYGPFHFPEKLIPLTILKALSWQTIPIYGDGQQIRDWLYVRDHCSAIRQVLERGRCGETYNIGGANEFSNLQVVTRICEILDELKPAPDGQSYRSLVSFVSDRPGHDRRYAMDITKISTELDWQPTHTFESGLEMTVRWYLENQVWVDNVSSGAYLDWVKLQYDGA